MDVHKLTPEDCIYTACYCEENIWKLCEMLNLKVDISNYFVVFISNVAKQIPLWCQKSSKDPSNMPVVWDYHVVLVCAQDTGCSLVFDLDTTLAFPCTLNEYSAKALRREDDFKQKFYRMFRVIPASLYLKTFASNRSHMLTDTGQWKSPPPPYPPIMTKDCEMNLRQHIEMTSASGPGELFNLLEFRKRFQCQT